MYAGSKKNYAAGGSVAPNRAQAYTAARKAEGPQKGLSYSELLVDNILGLDNDYLSFGEQFGQGFKADELGTLKNMALGAYEGAKKAVTEPLTTAEELLSGLYDSVSNLATEDLDARLTRMYGVGYQDATGDQVNKAREAVFGDALTAAQLVPGTAAIKKGLDAVGKVASSRMSRSVPGGIATLAEPPEVAPTPAPAFAPGATEANPRLYELLNRANLGDPLTEEEAFDVITYERYGPLAVGDPDVTFENWQSGEADYEGAHRIYYLTNPGAGTEGANPLPLGGGLTLADRPRDNFEPLAVWEFDDYDPADVYDDAPAGFDDYDPDHPENWDLPDDVIDDMNEGMLRGGRPRPELRQATPVTQRTEGIASLYSPSRKAVDLLDRPSYDDLDSLRVQLGNRGAKPDEMERIVTRLRGETGPISKERLAQVADEQAGEIAVSRVTRDSAYNDSERTYVDPTFFLGGADNIGANVFEMPVEGQAFSGADAHFRASAPGKVPLMHTRTGMMRSSPSSSPDVYHLGEIQSDWAQVRNKLFKTEDEADEAFEQLENLKKSEFFEPEAEGKLRDRIYFHQMHGTRGEFDANYPAPYMGNTDKWVQLGLRQSLIDAVNSGSRRMTMSTGDQARGYTGGSKEGQRKFYDDIVPKNLNEVLKKFAKEAGIPKPEITRTKVYGKGGQEHEVPVVEFTDEFIEAIKRIGLPSFAKGGIVPGSLLDVDIFEPIPLY